MPTALVVGATGGIGSAVVEALHLAGWSLHAAARTASALDTLAERDVTTHALDARDREALDRAVAATAEDAGEEPPGLVLAVGSIDLAPAHRTSPEAFEAVLAENLVTAFNLVAAAGNHCRHGASVVLFSSAAARIGLMNHEAIAAAKAGVEGLVRSAAATYAQRGLRVNAVAPGLVDTPLAARLTKGRAAREASERLHPLGRIGQPADIAPVVTWLLDPATSWVTGQVLSVDGGLSACRSAR